MSVFRMACNEKVANLWAARVIPAILIGVVGYSTYVVVVQVCSAYASCAFLSRSL